MTLTKLALAVLGTIGLTAGTVLAVAEPTAAPLPTAVAQVSEHACPGSACASGKCSTGACPFSATTVPVSACTAGKCSGEKCDSEKCTAPPEQSEPIAAELEESPSIAVGGPVGTCLADKLAACSDSTACRSLFDADGICRKHFVGGGKSRCVVTDDVVLTSADSDRCHDHSCQTSTCTASTCTVSTCTASTCTASTCSASVCEKTSACSAEGCQAAACDGQCKGECSGKCDGECSGECEETCPAPVAAKKAARRITLGIGLSTRGPTVHVATETNGESSDSSHSGCSAASAVGRIVFSLIDSGEHAACCDAPHEVAATACNAKPVSVSLGCPVASCAASPCDRCSVCDCTPCECENASCAEHSEQAASDESQHDEYEVDLYGDGRRYTIHRSAIHLFDRADPVSPRDIPRPHVTVGAIHFDGVPPVIAPGRHSEASRNYDSVYVRDDADNVGEAPGRVRVTHGPVNVHYQYLPEPSHLPLSPRIRLSGFAAPIAAPLPPRAISPRLEGTWTRTSGDATSSFTFRDGRVSGRWSVANGTEICFSGTCAVMKDDQFIGIIDEIEAKGQSDESTLDANMLAQRLVDQPFAARFVSDGDSLIIKHVRCSGLTPTIDEEDASTELLQFVRLFGCGRYEHVNE